MSAPRIAQPHVIAVIAVSIGAGACVHERTNDYLGLSGEVGVAPPEDTDDAIDGAPTTSADTSTTDASPFDASTEGSSEDAISCDTPSSWWLDADADGHGAGAPVLACDAPPDHVDVGDDCDDGDQLANPALTEVCDTRDNDCDGLLDEASELNEVCHDCYVFSEAGDHYAFCFAVAAWAEASEGCATAFDAALVEIDDDVEQVRLASIVADLWATNWWIGLSDRQLEGTYAWAGGTPLGYAYWGEAQPDNIGDEDCTELHPAFDYAWNDYGCEIELPFVCELG